jgi:hypothetical protein
MLEIGCIGVLCYRTSTLARLLESVKDLSMHHQFRRNNAYEELENDGL